MKTTGAVVLSYYDSGSRSFYSNKKPIRVRSDFAGQRIRIQGSPVYKDLITLLGGIPVVLRTTRLSMHSRTAKSTLPKTTFHRTYRATITNHARYYSFDEHSSVPEVLLMSKKAWDSLSPAHQKAVMTAAAESNAYMKKLWAEAEAQGLAKAKKEGSVILEKHQLGMSGIEAFAVKLYSKYVTNL